MFQRGKSVFGWLYQAAAVTFQMFVQAASILDHCIHLKIPSGLFLFVCRLAAQSISALSRPPTTAPLNFYLQTSLNIILLLSSHLGLVSEVPRYLPWSLQLPSARGVIQSALQTSNMAQRQKSWNFETAAPGIILCCLSQTVGRRNKWYDKPTVPTPCTQLVTILGKYICWGYLVEDMTG